MITRQRGALSLTGVAIVSALFAAVAMAALYSMRYERNVFAEGWDKLVGGEAAGAALGGVRAATGTDEGAAPLRKCVIDGKTVVSNVDCTDANGSSRDIDIQVTRGVEAPKVPVAPPAEPTSNPALDRMIEKQL